MHTNRLSGMRTRLRTAERESSGMYRERSVLMSGKWMPQHSSNRTKLQNTSTVDCCRGHGVYLAQHGWIRLSRRSHGRCKCRPVHRTSVNVGTKSAKADTRYMRGAIRSAVQRDMRPSKTREPIMTATMKLEKIQPNGSDSSWPCAGATTHVVGEGQGGR